MKQYKKIIWHTLGFIIIALGITNIITSKLGASPVDAFNYFLHFFAIKMIPLITLGTVIIITGLVVTLIAYLFNKDKNMLISAIFIFVVGIFVDMWLFLFGFVPDSLLNLMVMRIFLATSGMILCAIGVSITILTGLPSSPYERLMLIIDEKIDNITVSKIIVESSFLVLAVILGLSANILFEQVHIFTVVMTFMMGILVGIFTKIMSKRILKGELENGT